MRYAQIAGSILLILLVGCGGHHTPQAPQIGTGSVLIAVEWPQQAEGVEPQLIPEASNSIKAEIAGIEETLTINRPQTTGTLEDVPAGQHTLRATAYPEPDASGVPQAMAEKIIMVVAGETSSPEHLTLSSTIDHIDITPDPASVQVGDTIQLIATAKDDSDCTVLVRDNSPFSWTVISGLAYASVGQYTGEVSGLAEGTATVQATEQESGVSSSATVSVSVAGGPGAWPMLGHDERHTGHSPYRGPASPTIRWRLDLGAPEGGQWFASPVIGSSSRVYVIHQGMGMVPKLYCISSSGQVEWATEDVLNPTSAPAIGADGTIYTWVETSVGAYNALGQRLWVAVPNILPSGGSPCIASDGTIYVFGALCVAAVSESGTLLWKTPDTLIGGVCSPAIGAGGSVIVGGLAVQAYSPSGSLLWGFPGDLGVGAWNNSQAAIGDDGTIFFPDLEEVYAITPDGQKKWKYTIPGGYNGRFPSIGSGGSVLVGDTGGTMWCLASNGAVVWSASLGSAAAGQPVVDCDGALYVATEGGDLVSLASSGTERWRVNIGSSIDLSSCPAMAADGTIIVCSDDGFLTAVGE